MLHALVRRQCWVTSVQACHVTNVSVLGSFHANFKVIVSHLSTSMLMLQQPDKTKKTLVLASPLKQRGHVTNSMKTSPGHSNT